MAGIVKVRLITAAAFAVVAGIATLRFGHIGVGRFVWLAATWLNFVIRAPHLPDAKAIPVTLNRRDRQEQLLLGGMFATMLVLPLIHLATGLFTFANYTIPQWAVWIGAAIQPLAIWLFWRSHADLGRNWSASLEVREDHKLIDHGVYARIRHPMYSSIWLSALSQPLLIQNWIAGALIILAFAAMMRAEFSDAYADYCRRTGRFLPKLG